MKLFWFSKEISEVNTTPTYNQNWYDIFQNPNHGRKPILTNCFHLNRDEGKIIMFKWEKHDFRKGLITFTALVINLSHTL